MSQAPALPRGFELPLEPRIPRIGSVDAVAVEERAGELAKRSIKKEAKVCGAQARDPDDGPDHARGEGHAGQGAPRCARRRCVPTPIDPSDPVVAAVCVYPNLVADREEGARGHGREGRARRDRVPVRPVAARGEARRRARGGRSWAPTRSTWSSTAARSSRAATRRCSTRSSRVKEACGEAHLKVILETGELGTYDNVRRASQIAMAAGADFIKTSTGKISPAATLAGDARDARGDPRRLRRDRAAGRHEAGRRHPHREAGAPVPRACSTRRSATRWLTPELFRFGASTLLNDVLMQLRKQSTGATRRPTTSRWTDEREGSRRRERAPTPAPRRRGSTRPRPRRATSSSFAERYGLFIGGECVEPRSRQVLRRRSTRRPRSSSPRSPRRTPRTSISRSAPRARRTTNDWSKLRPAERAKYLFRIARILQERSRELAVARDDGRRQADQGVARRRRAARGGALLLLRGLGRQARVRVPERTPAAARRRRRRSSRGTSRC